jgi:signal transduction histidine kinase
MDTHSTRMEDVRRDLQIAESNRTLFLLDARIAAARAELARSEAEGDGDGDGIRRRQATFLAMVAHELRHPLAPIRIAAELLLRHASPHDALLARVQGILVRQVAHLSRLVEDLLDGARANEGKFRLECRTLVLQDVLEPVIDAIWPAMERRRQVFALRLPPAPVWVHADPVRLTQIFGNLLDNASKYTPHGGEIGFAVSNEGPSAILRVTDEGIGISAEALPRIFQLFVQESHARAQDGQGLGIGLAVVRELVQAHGGTLSAASAGRGLGSEFVVTLPTALAAAPEGDVRGGVEGGNGRLAGLLSG